MVFENVSIEDKLGNVKDLDGKFYKTAGKSRVKGIDYRWYINKGKYGNLLYVNRETAHTVFGMDKKKSSHLLSVGRGSIPASGKKRNGLLDIRVKLKKENPELYQRAYHGSPYNFDTFDLGAIEKRNLTWFLFWL